MVLLTAVTTIGHLGQNLLQVSLPSLATFTGKAKADAGPRRPVKERLEADIHRGGVETDQNEMQNAVADVHWQSLLTVTGATGESCEPAECFMKHSNDKISVPRRAHSPRFHRASQPHLPEPDQTPPLISPHNLGVPFSKR